MSDRVNWFDRFERYVKILGHLIILTLLDVLVRLEKFIWWLAGGANFLFYLNDVRTSIAH